MRWVTTAFLSCVPALVVFAASMDDLDRRAAAGSADSDPLAVIVEQFNLDFEASDQPEGWNTGGEGYSAVIDEETRHSGERSLRLSFQEPGAFGFAKSSFPVDAARRQRLVLAGFIKTEDVSDGWAGLWMRVDGPDGMLAIDNMRTGGIVGTTDWTACTIALYIPGEAVGIFFGALLTGKGTAWVDTLSVSVERIE